MQERAAVGLCAFDSACIELFPAIIDFTYFLHERICTSSQQRPSMTFRTSVGQRTMLSSDVV
ncbi:hypothetical protein, partial [Escherichia coli]|uniref:hypothetical protein n=1 Tax=Escherichia coli TaxID=562 RepID=UPI001BC8431D